MRKKRSFTSEFKLEQVLKYIRHDQSYCSISKEIGMDLQINKPEQVWVSDITYIGKREKPCCLRLITDAYSKKIVGNNVSDNLNTESRLDTLRLAIKQMKNKEIPF